MDKKNNTASELRRKAEEKVASLQAPSGEEDAKRLLNELQVHQVELEMQNEELQRALSEMREHKERLGNIVSYTPAGYFCIDTDGRFIEVNNAWLRMFGYNSPDEVIGKHFSLIQVDSELQKQQTHLAKLLKGEAIPSGEFASHRKDGSIGYHTFSAHPVVHADKIVRLEWFLIDISDRKKHDTYIDISREALQIMNEPQNMKDTLDRVIVLLKNQMDFDAVGIRLQEGDDFPYTAQDGFSKDFLLKENDLVERNIDGGVCRNKDGCINLECTCGLVISGKADTSLPFFTLGGSFWTNDSLPLLDIPHDADPRQNPRNECIHLGYASVALVPIRVKEKIVGLIQFNDKHKGRFDLDTVQLLEVIATNIGSTLLRKRLEDEKVLLEQQFQQAQKLESLGVLAGGIAHDFNNILAIIMGYCALVKMDYDTAEEYIPGIETATQRAAALCRQMLTYAGKAQSVMAQVDVKDIVAEMVTMLKATTSQNVIIRADLPASMPDILGDASQLRQVVMNLIINASEAIGENQGVIKVSLARTEIKTGQSDKDHNGKIIPAGHYICLDINDSGCGMDNETRQRIFEPFFTTKFTGRGLGMSALLGIITAHKGALQLSSEPGKGTTFKVYLPVQISASAEEGSPHQEAQTPWKGSGTVLLVEDEEQGLFVGKAILKAIGFTVIGASNGREALVMYKENAADITLVLTDMGMPVMDGYELFRELKMINPELPIVISSGFGDSDVTARIPRKEIAGLIHKPYDPDQLREVLKRVVDDSKINQT